MINPNNEKERMEMDECKNICKESREIVHFRIYIKNTLKKEKEVRLFKSTKEHGV
jgi:hypothetical protein